MTDRNNGTRERIVAGLAERGYTLNEMLSTGAGASGSVVFKGEYEGKPVALKLASYGLLNSFAGENVEKLKDFRRREVETLRLAGNHSNIPNYIESFNIEGNNQDPVYILVMEYLDYPSIAARIRAGERISDEEAKILLKDGLSAEDHLHTKLPTQILHRDIKTPNVLINGKKAYLIDFDIVKQGDRNSTRATNIEPNGYYPADFYGAIEEAQKPEHDVVALGNVAAAGIAGKEIGPLRYEQGLYGLEPVNTSRLNVSPAIRDYLAKMIAPPGKRFQTAREALEGLERIIGLSVALHQPVPQPTPARSQGERAKMNTINSGIAKRARELYDLSQSMTTYLIGYKKEVGGDQVGFLAALNVAREVGRDQVGFLAANVAKQIGMKKGNLEGRISNQIGIINYAGEGNVNQYGVLNIRGSGPWYSRISPFYGKLRASKRKLGEAEAK